jgi:signal transduction histidine kinase/ActR/RegA family two-component response regulator
MQELYNLIAENENWLVKRVLYYAKKNKFTKYTSTLEEAWRMSIIGLSSSILIGLKDSRQISEMTTYHEYLSDPVASFGILEAKRHRKRGVHFNMFLGLMKYYRRSYLDLIAEGGFERNCEDRYRLSIDRVFDRIEIGFSSEWLKSVESQLVTEMQNSNRLLTNEKNWYLTMFESLPTPVIFLNRNKSVENMNFAASQLLQFSKVSGAYYYCEDNPAIPFNWFDEELKAFAQSSESEFVFERAFELKDGVTHFEVKLARMLDVSEKFSGVVIILNNISDRKKMEDLNLITSQKEWADTFNTISDMITIHDRDFKIVRANNAAKELLKLPTLFDIDAKCYEYFHGSECPPENCLSCECLAKGETVTVEKFEPHLNKFLEIRAIPRFDGSNNVVGVIHVCRDITERKKLEEQLRESQKMKAIGHLAGGIAHDFNNLLTAIKGSAYLLRKKLDRDDPVMVFVEQILEASDGATSLVQGLLAYSRKQIITTKPLQVNETITKLGGLIRRLIGEDIEIKMNLASRELMIMADRVQIEQVLMNIVINARDAMPEGGMLSISTETVFLNAFAASSYGIPKPGEYVCIEISDDGVGIDEEVRGNIFEPFYTTKEVGKGTGLGLSIVYGIIKQHDGHIIVHSKLGKGTAFTIFLPVIAATYDAQQPARDVPLTEGTETILLAEDEGVVRKTMRNIFEDAGYNVIEAVDGDDALDKFKKNLDTLRIVVLDVIMPRKNGKEVREKMREIKPDIKILLTSGYSAGIIDKKGILENEMHFFPKPGSPEELLLKVREILDEQVSCLRRTNRKDLI